MKKIIFLMVAASLMYADSGEQLVSDNGCLSCHAVASRKAAPAFAGIAKRNLRFNGSGAKSVIMDTIKNGSQGKYPRFSGTKMPSFNYLSNQQIDAIADYILSQASKAKGHGGNGMGHGMGMGKGRL